MRDIVSFLIFENQYTFIIFGKLLVRAKKCIGSTVIYFTLTKKNFFKDHLCFTLSV